MISWRTIQSMRTTLMSRVLGPALCLMLLSSHAASPPKLPAELSINYGAGRGGLLIVPVRLEGGEGLPFVLDTGSSFTLLDKSLEPKLGKRTGTASVQSWGVSQKLPVFAAPRLYLGGAPLVTGDQVVSDDCKKMPSDSDHPIMGMLGIDCLKHYCIQLDFAAGKIRFLEPEHVNAAELGKAFPITYVGGRPFVHHDGLVAGMGTNSLIDTGYDTDGVINELGPGPSYFEERVWGGQTYTNLLIGTGGYVLGLRFLARHLVTLDFLNGTMYLRQQSVGPLPGGNFMVLQTTRIEALEPLLRAVVHDDVAAARKELLALERGSAPEFIRTVARKLVGTMKHEPKPVPAKVPPAVTELALGDAQPRIAEVGCSSRRLIAYLRTARSDRLCWIRGRSMPPVFTRTRPPGNSLIWAANGGACAAKPVCTRPFSPTPSVWFLSSRPMAGRSFVPLPFVAQPDRATPLT